MATVATHEERKRALEAALHEADSENDRAREKIATAQRGQAAAYAARKAQLQADFDAENAAHSRSVAQQFQTATVPVIARIHAEPTHADARQLAEMAASARAGCMGVLGQEFDLAAHLRLAVTRVLVAEDPARLGALSQPREVGIPDPIALPAAKAAEAVTSRDAAAIIVAVGALQSALRAQSARPTGDAAIGRERLDVIASFATRSEIFLALERFEAEQARLKRERDAADWQQTQRDADLARSGVDVPGREQAWIEAVRRIGREVVARIV